MNNADNEMTILMNIMRRKLKWQKYEDNMILIVMK